MIVLHCIPLIKYSHLYSSISKSNKSLNLWLSVRCSLTSFRHTLQWLNLKEDTRYYWYVEIFLPSEITQLSCDMSDKYSVLLTLNSVCILHSFFINTNWSSCSQVPVCLKIQVLRIAVVLKLLQSIFVRACILLLTKVIYMNNMFIINLHLYICRPLELILHHTFNYFWSSCNIFTNCWNGSFVCSCVLSTIIIKMRPTDWGTSHWYTLDCNRWLYTFEFCF